MIDEFRSVLDDELSLLSQPPLGDLVGTAARRGRRVRHFRMAAGAAASVAALSLVTALVTGSGNSPTQPEPLGVAAAPSAAAGATSGASQAPADRAPAVASASAGAQVDTTSAALLAAVLDALPGQPKTDHYGVVSGTRPGAQAYLNSSRGTGMLRVFLAGKSGKPLSCDPQPLPGKLVPVCSTDARGQQVVVVTIPDNCVENVSVEVRHTDGTIVQAVLSSCLEWDGRTNPPGVRPLTTEQAIALAGDPSISTRMDSDYVQAAAQRFPALATFH
ncbi:hypothetical protein [Kitasatospora sp. McL0602]|uniref:hypothetical protein n=1 Tax=Kitasatospora sp. McL0602 TaxID=3439530 RepID=UPI003F8B9FA8